METIIFLKGVNHVLVAVALEMDVHRHHLNGFLEVVIENQWGCSECDGELLAALLISDQKNTRLQEIVELNLQLNRLC